jgi:hypothetical protein
MEKKIERRRPQPMADVYAVRRNNLLLLVDQHGGRKQLGAALGYSNGSYISQLLGTPPKRPLTETTARSIETKLGLSSGWLDMVRTVSDGA